jgi:hypothetical protein
VQEADSFRSEREALRQRIAALADDRSRLQAAEASHAQALGQAQTAHEAQLLALRGQLVDAEAALSKRTAKRLPEGPLARLLPASFPAPCAGEAARQQRPVGPFMVRRYLSRCRRERARRRGALSSRNRLLPRLSAEPFFDMRAYLERHEDVRRSGVNALLHYLD